MPYRIAFFEPDHTGHHLPYLARALGGFVDLDVELTLVTSPACPGSVEFGKSLAGFGSRLKVVTPLVGGPSSPLRNGIHRFRQLQGVLSDLKPDHFFIMYADGLWQLAEMASRLRLFSVPKGTVIEAILYRGGLAYPDAKGRSVGIKRALFTSMLRRATFSVLHMDDELLFDFAATHVGSQPVGGSRLVLTPNPVELRPMASIAEHRARCGLPADGRMIATTGMIAAYKGATQLIDAFCRFATSSGARPTDRLLLAGPHDAGAKARLLEADAAALTAAGRIIHIDRFLSDQDMFDFTGAGDVVSACYPNHSGRSSIILWAAATGRRVLAAERGCIGHVVKTNGLGDTVDPHDGAAFASQIGVAMDRAWSDADVRRVRGYSEFHSFANYRASISRFARERIGAPLLPQIEGVTAGQIRAAAGA